VGHFGATARVQPRYQVTLPKEVRCALGVEPGDSLMFVRTEDGGWRVRKKPGSFLELADEIRAKAAGVVTLDDVFRWRQEEDPES
jgi:AbrB family looped-hinge helix DNA binding protein